MSKDGILGWTGVQVSLCLPLLAFFLVFPTPDFAQEAPRVSSAVDTASIRIGEQIHWTVAVEVDSSAQVIFPEGQTFSPLETVEAFKTDTTRKNSRILLQKTYALTQFDSGAYLLPTQPLWMAQMAGIWSPWSAVGRGALLVRIP